MTAYAQDAELDRIVIAQAEGILAARHGMPIADAFSLLRDDARALGVSIGLLAEDLVGRAGAPERTAGPGSVGADLDEEIALQAEIRRRRPDPLALDAVTEARLRTLLH